MLTGPVTIARAVPSMAASQAHIARTVCRRAERRLIALQAEDPQDEALSHVLVYLNRLSDLLFVVARVVARAEKGTEVLWNRERS